MPSQQLLAALGETLGSGSLVSELLSLSGGSGSGVEISATDPAYGVIGDGIADDTAALQRAIDAAELAGDGAVLIIPAGTYLVQDPAPTRGFVAPLALSADGITVIAWGATLKIGPNGVGGDVSGLTGGHSLFEITGNRCRVFGLKVDVNAGVSLAAKDNSVFKIQGTVEGEGDDNLLFGCQVINGSKAEVDVTQGEECFVITNGHRNRIVLCLAQDAAWQGFRATGGHNQIIDCTCLGHRGNGLRVIDGDSLLIRGFICVQTLAAGGRTSIMCDPGSATDATTPENDVDRIINEVVIRDCILINAVNGPDGTVNCIKIAGVGRAVVEGCYINSLGSQNTALRLEDVVHECTVRNCYITPNLILAPATGLVLQSALNGTVASANLNLDVDGDGTLDGATNYVVYTVVSHSLQLGKTIWVRGSSVAEYNGPQQVVATTSTTITTNRKYVSASIGSAAWAHSGIEKLDVIDCTFVNDQVDNTYALENLNVPFVNIENCRFKNTTENTVKQGHINIEYNGDFAMQRVRFVKNRFFARTTNLVRAIRPTDTALVVTSGKVISWGNEVFNDRTSTHVALIDTYDAGDTTPDSVLRTLIFNSDGDVLGRYFGTAAPTGATITFSAGDYVRNTAPGATGIIGWLCTAGGAPGTWRAQYVSDVLSHNVTEVANGTTVETDLMTYSLPDTDAIAGAVLGANGEGLDIECGFSFAANGNTKTVKFYLGATEIYTSGAAAHNGGALTLRVRILRDGAAAAQKCHVTAVPTGTGTPFVAKSQYTATTINLAAGATVIKATGQSGTASSDVVQEWMTVRHLRVAG